MSCFGIHIGNSSMCIASSRDGKTDVIANDQGDRVTPAILVHNGTEYEMCAASKTLSRVKAIIKSNKHALSNETSEEEVEALNSKTDCKLIKYENSQSYELQSDSGRKISITPQQVATKFYSKLFSIASHAAPNEEEIKTVLAVPLRYSQELRNQIISAGEIAGLSILQVINEPTAAVLAYNIGEDLREEYTLVYRLGGFSCDVSIISAIGGLYTIESSTHVTGIGGQFITKVLANYIAGEFYHKRKLDVNENRRAVDKLFHYANDCKHVLSTLQSSHLFIESLYEGVDWSQNVSRARFENLISSQIDSFKAPIRKILSESGLQNKITKIVMCGGSMKIPKLQSAISELLPNAEVLNNLNPDEVIAIGCAKQAALLLEYPEVTFDESSTTIDCITSPIYAKYADTNICLFPVGCPIYSEVVVPFKRQNKSLKIDLHVYEQGETNQAIGDFSFTCSSENLKIHAILQNKNLELTVS